MRWTETFFIYVFSSFFILLVEVARGIGMEGSGEHSEAAWEIRLAGASGLSIRCLEGKCILATRLV